nr:MAG TPA: hypothetical protein [Caudoviricetes sp.]
MRSSLAHSILSFSISLDADALDTSHDTTPEIITLATPIIADMISVLNRNTLSTAFYKSYHDLTL